MKIGQLRHLVGFLRPVTTRDRYGQVNASNTYTLYASRRVSIGPTASQELLTGSKPEGQTTYKIGLRYLADVQLNDRILWGERIFDICGMKNLEERNLWLELTAIELIRPAEYEIVEP